MDNRQLPTLSLLLPHHQSVSKRCRRMWTKILLNCFTVAFGGCTNGPRTPSSQLQVRWEPSECWTATVGMCTQCCKDTAGRCMNSASIHASTRYCSQLRQMVPFDFGTFSRAIASRSLLVTRLK